MFEDMTTATLVSEKNVLAFKSDVDFISRATTSNTYV